MIRRQDESHNHSSAIQNGNCTELRSIEERAFVLLEQTPHYVDHPRFHEADFIREFSKPREVRVDTRAERVGDADFYTAFLFESRLLTREEEQDLFLRMNFAKYRGAKLRQRLECQDPERALVAQIELLDAEAADLRSYLAECNLRLVTSIARRFSQTSGVPMDDLLGEGHVALMGAIEHFDAAQGNKFSTYATYAIRNRMIAHLRTIVRQQRWQSEAEPPLIDSNASDEDLPHHQNRIRELQEVLTPWMSQLSERELMVVGRRFGFEDFEPSESLKAIADDLGVSRQRVQQVYASALGKLKGMADRDGLDLSDLT